MDRLLEDGVEHGALAPGARPLDLLARGALADRVDLPPAVGRGPVDRPVGIDPPHQVERLARVGGRRQGLGDAPVDPILDPPAGRDVVGLHDGPRVGVAVGDVRPAEAPAGAERHIDVHPDLPRLDDGVTEHRHPARAEILDRPIFEALRAVDRDDVDAAESRVAIPPELASDVRLIDGAAHPPPVGPRPGRGRRLGPGCRRFGRDGGHRPRREAPGEQDHRGQDRSACGHRGTLHGWSDLKVGPTGPPGSRTGHRIDASGESGGTAAPRGNRPASPRGIPPSAGTGPSRD